MEPETTGRLVAQLYDAAHLCPPGPDLDVDLEALVHEWDALDETLGMVKARRDAWALELGSRLADMEYNRREGVTVDGVTVHHVQYPREEYNGPAVLNRLQRAAIDPTTGETFEAVAREVLDDVLPAVTEGRTSSRWRVTGLRSWGVPLVEVRRVEYSEPTAKRGGAT